MQAFKKISSRLVRNAKKILNPQETLNSEITAFKTAILEERLKLKEAEHPTTAQAKAESDKENPTENLTIEKSQGNETKAASTAETNKNTDAKQLESSVTSEFDGEINKEKTKLLSSVEAYNSIKQNLIYQNGSRAKQAAWARFKYSLILILIGYLYDQVVQRRKRYRTQLEDIRNRIEIRAKIAKELWVEMRLIQHEVTFYSMDELDSRHPNDSVYEKIEVLLARATALSRIMKEILQELDDLKTDIKTGTVWPINQIFEMIFSRELINYAGTEEKRAKKILQRTEANTHLIKSAVHILLKNTDYPEEYLSKIIDIRYFEQLKNDAKLNELCNDFLKLLDDVKLNDIKRYYKKMRELTIKTNNHLIALQHKELDTYKINISEADMTKKAHANIARSHIQQYFIKSRLIVDNEILLDRLLLSQAWRMYGSMLLKRALNDAEKKKVEFDIEQSSAALPFFIAMLIKPSNPYPLNNIGVLYLVKAIHLQDKQPPDELAKNQAADLLVKAEKWFKLSIYMHPTYDFAHSNLALNLVKMGEIDQATKLIENAEKMDKQNLSTRAVKAIILYNQGEYAEASALLNSINLTSFDYQPILAGEIQKVLKGLAELEITQLQILTKQLPQARLDIAKPEIYHKQFDAMKKHGVFANNINPPETSAHPDQPAQTHHEEQKPS